MSHLSSLRYACLLALTGALGAALAQADDRACPGWDCALADAASAAGLPAWLKFSGLERMRLEVPTGTGYQPGARDFYALSRFRLGADARLGHYGHLYAEMQDSRALGYDSGVPASSLHDPFDLRQLYYEYGSSEKPGVRLKVGRQELVYAGNWLFAVSEWPNSGRVFDAAVVAAFYRGWQADFFAGSVVLADAGRPNRHKPGEHVYGSYFARAKSSRLPRLEAFLVAKQQLLVTPELGAKGDSVIYAAGARSVGTFFRRFDYHLLLEQQWGRYSADHVQAWGGDAMLGYAISKHGWKPRLSIEATLASGDNNSKDGTRHTFDPLYGSYHTSLGTADRLGWRNSRNLRAGVDLAPSRKWKITLDVRDLALLNVADSLYNASGTREWLNAKATSKHIGVELDAYFSYQFRPTVSLGAGMGYLIPGEYVHQTTSGASYLYPYLMVTKKF